jgi:hypothetical protein
MKKEKGRYVWKAYHKYPDDEENYTICYGGTEKEALEKAKQWIASNYTKGAFDDIPLLCRRVLVRQQDAEFIL